MFNVGDKVYVEDSAQVDVGFQSWSYINGHREATVKHKMEFAALGVDLNGYIPQDKDYIYALEWPEKFSGAHSCQDHCAPNQGHFISAKHLDLRFEASREVQTIPNIEG